MRNYRESTLRCARVSYAQIMRFPETNIRIQTCRISAVADSFQTLGVLLEMEGLLKLSKEAEIQT